MPILPLQPRAASRARRSRLNAVLAALTAVALGRAPALATTAADLCAANADPCEVSRTVNVDDGSVIDVGARHLRILSGGQLSVGTGTMTVNAGRLTVEFGGQLRGRAGAADSGGTMTVIAGLIQIAGPIDFSGSPGGTVTIQSDGELTVGATIDANSRGLEDSGGTIRLEGETVLIGAAVAARGGRDDFGGDIAVVSRGELTVNAALDASGGDGGSVDLSGVTVAINTVGAARADASASGGDGGDLDVSAGDGAHPTGALTLNGELSAAGRAGTEGGGSGGTISASGYAGIAAAATARLLAGGGGPDGSGGDIDLRTVAGSIVTRADYDIEAAASEGSGGTLTLDATGAIDLGGSVSGSGGGNGGGDIDLTAGDRLEVVSGAQLDVRASGTGTGGSITLAAGGVVHLAGALRADGGSAQSALGGNVELSGCTLIIESSGSVSNARPSGVNRLIGREDTVIAGTLQADASTGRNEFRFRSPDRRPVLIGGAVVIPSAVEVVDSALLPCDATPVPSPTPTRTPTPSRTPTRSPQPFGCAADCNGDNMVEVSELITATNIALGLLPLDACLLADHNFDGAITIDELVAAVAAALGGC